MSKKILFQSLLKFRDQIKDGTAKVQDVITDYFNQTGKSVTDEERAIILNEFAKDAPDNVTTLEGVDAVETIMPMGGTKTPFTDQVRKENPGVEITGRETFGELMEKLGRGDKINEEGIGSLFPKDKDGFDDRAEAAEFVRKMRGAGIKNEDIRKIFKENPPYRKKSNFLSGRDETILDLEPGKRAATTLARAADMKADTKIKQELLSELDEMKMDREPRFFQEEYMGFDDFRSAEDAKKIEVNNAIVDDLEAMGVEDDTVMFIMGRAREINKKPFYTSGEDFVDIIKDELEFQGIDYDVEFYKNYFRELTGLMRKPKPRFMYGGVV
jgi:hypothetical protein